MRGLQLIDRTQPPLVNAMLAAIPLCWGTPSVTSGDSSLKEGACPLEAGVPALRLPPIRCRSGGKAEPYQIPVPSSLLRFSQMKPRTASISRLAPAM